MHASLQPSTPEIWVFRVSSRYRRLRSIVVTCSSILLAGLGLFLLLYTIFIAALDPIAIVVGTICISIACIWRWRFQRWVETTSLTVSPTTLDYQTPGLRIQTEWSNVIAVVDGLDPPWAYLPRPHLLLNRPAGVYVSALTRITHMRSHGWHVDRRIPLDSLAGSAPASCGS